MASPSIDAATWRPKADPPENTCCCACLDRIPGPPAEPEAAADFAAKLAENAKEVFPGNAPGYGSMSDGVLEPQHIVALHTKYWGPSPRVLSVSFIEFGVPQQLKERILYHMNAWQPCCIYFSLVPDGQVGNVRITLNGDPYYGGGFWSLLGTDINTHPPNRATMCLQGFSMNTNEADFTRVVRHETGHTLGFPHEHLRADIVARINQQAAYAYYGGWPNYWPPNKVQFNVLTPLPETNDLMKGTPTTDTISIMCYQLPGQIMLDGIAVLGGQDIDNFDRAFCSQIYPTASAPGPPPRPPPGPAPGRTYMVKQGDTLTNIARQFGTDLPTLERLNPDILRPGQTLNLP